MATRQQIRLQIRSLINESDPTNSHFTDSDLNSFIDQATRFSSSFIEYPRDIIKVQVQYNVGAYPLISDNLIIRNAYFGDPTITSDVKPLIIISEETLKELVPGWLDETANSNTGVPQFLIVLDRKTVYIHPRPDTTSSAAGKMLILGYVYSPATLSDDGNVPDLPLPYHDLIQFYCAHLCYAKLLDSKTSQFFETEFTNKIKALKPTVEKETKEGMQFQWGFDDGVNADSVGGITVT